MKFGTKGFTGKDWDAPLYPNMTPSPTIHLRIVDRLKTV